MTNPTPLKRIRLKHARNLRDLGGFATKENKTIKWNALFRSDGLSQLEAEEWTELTNRGVRTVIDLRSASEATNHPDRVPEHVTLIHCPVQKEQVDMKDLSESALKAFSDSLKDGYGDMITSHPELLVCALKAVIGGLQKGAVLFHCSAGKDRTGIVAATLLKLLGADDEDIIADYQVSYTYNRQGINRIAREMPQFEQIEPLLHSDPENMERLLDVFAKIDLHTFLLKHGMEEKELETLRTLMLE